VRVQEREIVCVCVCVCVCVGGWVGGCEGEREREKGERERERNTNTNTNTHTRTHIHIHIHTHTHTYKKVGYEGKEAGCVSVCESSHAYVLHKGLTRIPYSSHQGQVITEMQQWVAVAKPLLENIHAFLNKEGLDDQSKV
jgi:hypothetical protein